MFGVTWRSVNGQNTNFWVDYSQDRPWLTRGPVRVREQGPFGQFVIAVSGPHQLHRPMDGLTIPLKQGCQTQFLEGHSPAQFRFNPN